MQSLTLTVDDLTVCNFGHQPVSKRHNHSFNKTPFLLSIKLLPDLRNYCPHCNRRRWTAGRCLVDCSYSASRRYYRVLGPLRGTLSTVGRSLEPECPCTQAVDEFAERCCCNCYYCCENILNEEGEIRENVPRDCWLRDFTHRRPCTARRRRRKERNKGRSDCYIGWCYRYSSELM